MYYIELSFRFAIYLSETLIIRVHSAVAYGKIKILNSNRMDV